MPSGFGLEGTETVANPRAGLDAAFFFFLLFGGIVGGICGRSHTRQNSNQAIEARKETETLTKGEMRSGGRKEVESRT